VIPLEQRRVLSVTAVDAGLSQVVDEGTLIELQEAFYVDTAGSSNSPHRAVVDWGDGTTGDAGTKPPAQDDIGAVSAEHVFADDGVYHLLVTVRGKDGSQATSDGSTTITVRNVAPTLNVVGDQMIDEGATLSLTDIATFTDPGFGPTETFTYSIDWGDGTPPDEGTPTIDRPGNYGILTAGSFDGSHVYAEHGVYTVTVTIQDDDGGLDTGTFSVIVGNVDPILTVVGDQVTDEGTTLSVTDIGTFIAPSPSGQATDQFTYSIDWGDGTPTDTGYATIDFQGPQGSPTFGSFDGSHTYADDGIYTVTVVIYDTQGGSDTGSFTVTVKNVAPTIALSGAGSVDEGSLFHGVGSFVDPGADTWTATVDYGDGSGVQSLALNADRTFDLNHTFADDGIYTIAVTVVDDDGGSDTKTFTVTVGNVVPTISGVTGSEMVDEGSAFTFAQLGWGIEDPGFDNPDHPSGETRETFTSVYSVDWGDGTPVESGAILNRASGGPGVPTVAEFGDLPHTYADNGVYKVSVTFGDDDGPPVTYVLEVTVANVAPTVTPAAEQTVDEGAVLSVTDLATFTDPGFDNPLRPGGPSVETFSYEIDWGDGTAADTGPATIDLSGSVGVATAGSFDGSHVYADNGVYTVTLTVIDDDGGTTVATTFVTVLNVAPTVLSFDDNEMNALGQVTVEGSFFDPGFDNPQNPLAAPDGSRESFTVVIDWSDGTYDTILMGGPGPFHFTATHTYTSPPDPLNPAADIRIVATVTDDDGRSAVAETYAEVPGEGVEYVYIDTTPKVPRLVFPRAPRLDAGDLGTGSTEILLSSADYEPVRPDSAAASENYIVLRTVLPDGSESNDYRMPDNALNILPEILSRLPDNRYRVYEIRSDGPDRLVRDVFVRQHRVIDRTDASEGIEERPPQSQTVLPETVPPEADQSTRNPVTSTWEQWEARRSVSSAANETTADPGESARDGTSGDAEPAAMPPAALQTGGSSVLGTTLLAYRLRAFREREAEQTRERFAQWGASSSKEAKMYPTKPR
jgi:PKD repeat protein